MGLYAPSSMCATMVAAPCLQRILRLERSTDLIFVALTSSYRLALVMFSFNSGFIHVLGVVVENIELRSEFPPSFHGCPYCACLCLQCLSMLMYLIVFVSVLA